ncbi:MAG TPA: hypothetical protein VEO55_08760, partial [Candidatus Dormibacteraeota bacterium]|nr:hypothetical protein [Candidatus Dormibacteraeota bacterium]
MISREFRLFLLDASVRRFWRASILSLVIALGWMILAPAANAQRPKANELVKILSGTIDPPVRAGGTSILKIAAEVI